MVFNFRPVAWSLLTKVYAYVYDYIQHSKIPSDSSIRRPPELDSRSKPHIERKKRSP